MRERNGTAMAGNGLEGDVAGALLSDGQFSLAYSPVAALADGRVAYARADLRWAHPVRGRIGRDDVRDAVDGSSVARLVTEFALDAALAQAAAWRALGVDVAVSVELRAADLVANDTARRVRAAMTRAGVPAASLQVRVPSNAPMMSGPALASRTLATLGDLVDSGVSVALDETEWCASGIAALLEVPATAVCLDADFVGAMGRDPSSARVVRAVAAMARAAGMDVSAPGVTGRAQRDALSAMGVTHACGPLYGRAGDAEAFAKAVGRRQAPHALAA